jgi:hypothetical protein
MHTIRLFLRVPRQNIVRLCGIVEGYEGVAILRTIASQEGLLELLVAPAFCATALTLLTALAQEMELTLLDPDAQPFSAGTLSNGRSHEA